MSVLRGIRDRRFKFTQVLNSMLEDEKISLKAKGFITYCLSKPDAWQFYISHLASKLKEGEKAIYSTIDECIENGYAIRYQGRKENGGDFASWETIISDSKEEISLLKEELKNDPDFQKMFALRRFGDAQDAHAQKDPPSNTNVLDIQKDKVVCSATSPVGDSTLLKTQDQSQFCEKTHPDGHKIKISKQNLIKDLINKKCDFDLVEIEEAWKILVDCKQMIRNPIRYIEGTINQIRNSRTCHQITQKTQEKKKYYQNKKSAQENNQPKSEKIESSQKESNCFLGRDMWGRRLQKSSSQIQILQS